MIERDLYRFYFLENLVVVLAFILTCGLLAHALAKLAQHTYRWKYAIN